MTRYLIGLLCLGIAIHSLSEAGYFQDISRFAITDLLLSALFAEGVFFISGVKNRVLLQSQCQIRLRLSEQLWLPPAMDYWSFIIPFKGGLLFFMLYLRNAYQLSLVKLLSLTLYTYIVVLVLTGLAGLYYSLNFAGTDRWFLALSILFILSPLLVFIGGLVMSRLTPEGSAFLALQLRRVRSLLDSLGEGLANPRLLLLMVAISIVHLLARAAWNYWCNEQLEIGLSIYAVLFVVLVSQLSVIFRITPGNIGLNELLSGGAVTLVGGEFEAGLLLALFTRVSSLLVTFVAGPWFTHRASTNLKGLDAGAVYRQLRGQPEQGS